MSVSLGIAVVGTGFIGPVHIEALRRLGFRVKGILGSTPEKSRNAATALQLERGYNTFEEILQDSEVQSVHLASPNRLHVAHASAALAASKHVVCEKPLAMHSREAAELIRVADRYPSQIAAVNYNVRFYPLCLQVRGMIQQGELGRIFHVQGSYLQDWLLYPTDFNWRVLAEEGGETRAIGDIGTHWLDLVLHVTGLEVEALMADLSTVHPVRKRSASGSIETFTSPGTGPLTDVPISTEDHGSILLRLTNGAKASLVVSQVCAGRKNCIRFEIAGSKKSVAWNSESPNELWIGNRSEPNQVLLKDPSLLTGEARHHASYPGGHNEGFPDTFKQLYRSIYADILAGRRSPKPLYATFRDGYRELLLCEAILQSHRTQSWVRLDHSQLP